MGAWQKCCWNQATARWQAVTSTYWICHQKQASDQYKNYGERWWINGESMVNQWWINGESMVNQWWINGESMMNQWWISGKSMVNQWWIVVNNGILMVNTLVNTPGWCFGTWMDYDFPFSWEFHNPNWLWYFSQGLKPPTSSDQYKEDICLVVSNMNFIFHNIWDNPSIDELIFFQDG